MYIKVSECPKGVRSASKASERPKGVCSASKASERPKGVPSASKASERPKGVRSVRIGGIVISKRGRDKRRPFIIVGIDADFLYLADGALRKLVKPKRKKFMHVQITESISIDIAEKLAAGCLSDADLRKVLLRFEKNGEV